MSEAELWEALQRKDARAVQAELLKVPHEGRKHGNGFEHLRVLALNNAGQTDLFKERSVGLPSMLCPKCGSVLSAVTFTCVRGSYCQ